MQKAAANVDEYISDFPDEVKKRLEKLRGIIKTLVPAATETISYAIPTYVLDKSFIHFAGYKNHVALYPAPIESEAFREKLAPYASGKGTAQFSNNKPLPEDIIRDIVLYRAGLHSGK